MGEDNPAHGEPEPNLHFQHYWSLSNSKDETIAYAILTPRHGVLWLTLHVSGGYRRRGYATRLFNAVLERFGHEDIWLHVASWSDRAFDDPQLVVWYRDRWGFEETSVPGAMVRRGRPRAGDASS